MSLRGENRWPKWRLIKFAPKDGRDVLLCEEGHRDIAVGWWSGGEERWLDPSTSHPVYFEPTHFLPLPDAVGAPAVGEVA